MCLLLGIGHEKTIDISLGPFLQSSELINIGHRISKIMNGK